MGRPGRDGERGECGEAGEPPAGSEERLRPRERRLRRGQVRPQAARRDGAARRGEALTPTRPEPPAGLHAV